MKGQLWDICVMILTLGFLIFLVNAAFGSIDEAFRISAVINSEEITGVINVLQAAPSKTTYTYFLPAAECKLTIKSYESLTIVNFTSTTFGIANTGITEPLMKGLPIDDIVADCDNNEEKKIFFQRCSDAIRINENEVAC